MSIIEKAADRLNGNSARVNSPVPIKSFPDEGSRPGLERNRPGDRITGLHASDPQTISQIDLARLHHAGIVTPNTGRTRVAEQFRQIKRPLIRKAFGHGGVPQEHSNLIMVTSSLPGEGKTYCAVNLAMSIAMELDYTVLLIDADITRPAVLSTLGLDANTGLMDILLERSASLEDTLIRTNIETLTVLASGKKHASATELLASQTMSDLLDDVATRYRDRIVIFDSPPLLATSEASVLASQMGQIVMVVEAEKTPKHALKEALAQIEGYPNVNLVYNKGKGFPGEESHYYERD